MLENHYPQRNDRDWLNRTLSQLADPMRSEPALTKRSM